MTEEEAHELGRLVQQARKARELTLRALDELSGVTYRWIGRLERGEMRVPAPGMLTKIAEALDIAPEEIDRITGGQISHDLPPLGIYFRAKYRLTPKEIKKIEELFDQIRGSRLRTPEDETQN
jgi:transcriptional regulator with XRE-family HTH domain